MGRPLGPCFSAPASYMLQTGHASPVFLLGTEAIKLSWRLWVWRLVIPNQLLLAQTGLLNVMWPSEDSRTFICEQLWLLLGCRHCYSGGHSSMRFSSRYKSLFVVQQNINCDICSCTSGYKSCCVLFIHESPPPQGRETVFVFPVFHVISPCLLPTF